MKQRVHTCYSILLVIIIVHYHYLNEENNFNFVFFNLKKCIIKMPESSNRTVNEYLVLCVYFP